MAGIAPAARDEFDIAIICAIPTEYDAVCHIFDEFWDENGDRYGRAIGDTNTYTTGRIGKHNVVVALLPHMGKANAASSAASVRSSYDGLELVLLVGICGGVPVYGKDKTEILLGDVIISKQVIQYDFGRQYPDQFQRKDTFEDNLSKANKNIRTLLKSLETERGIDQLQSKTAQFLIQLQNKAQAKKRRGRAKPAYRYPGAVTDRLFQANYIHKHRFSHCNECGSSPDTVCEVARHAACDELGCEDSRLVTRETLQEKQEAEQRSMEEAQEPIVHVGAVASGDIVMKCGTDRDLLTKTMGIIAFEMEGAGIWEEVPSIVVKGVCDYADSHKNKDWQHFAAAAAAAAARALLEAYPKRDRAVRMGTAGEPNVVTTHYFVKPVWPQSSGPGSLGAQKSQSAIEEPQRLSGVTFNAPIHGHNVITGIHATAGGTVTNNFK